MYCERSYEEPQLLTLIEGGAWEARASLDTSPDISTRGVRGGSWLSAWESEGWGRTGDRCGGAVAEKEDNGEQLVVPLLCGQWSCPVCSRLRYRWFVRNCRRAIEDHQLRYFWTLTIDHKLESPAESWRLISAHWNRFRTALKRLYPQLAFVWVVEPTPRTGHAHLHVLMNVYVEHALVKRLWSEASGGSYVVYVERLENVDAAGYLAKYLQKGAGRLLEVAGAGALEHKHRWGKSRGIQFDAYHHKSEGWTLVERGYKDMQQWARKFGRITAENRQGVPRFHYAARAREVMLGEGRADLWYPRLDNGDWAPEDRLE